MFHLLVVAFLVVAGNASQEPEVDESVPPIQVYGLDKIHEHLHDGHHHDGHQRDGHHKHRPHNVYLHGVHDHKGYSKIDRIVTEMNNPDYIEPITVLDYRYLNTGGRDYTRGAGGQILILPKHVRLNQRKEFKNYDELLEFLRLKQLAESEEHYKELSKLGYAHGHEAYHKHRIEILGHHHQDHHDQREHYDRREYHDQREHHNHHNHQRLYGGYKRDAEAASQAEKKEIVE